MTDSLYDRCAKEAAASGKSLSAFISDTMSNMLLIERREAPGDVPGGQCFRALRGHCERSGATWLSAMNGHYYCETCAADINVRSPNACVNSSYVREG